MPRDTPFHIRGAAVMSDTATLVKDINCVIRRYSLPVPRRGVEITSLLPIITKSHRHLILGKDIHCSMPYFSVLINTCDQIAAIGFLYTFEMFRFFSCSNVKSPNWGLSWWLSGLPPFVFCGQTSRAYYSPVVLTFLRRDTYIHLTDSISMCKKKGVQLCIPFTIAAFFNLASPFPFLNNLISSRVFPVFRQTTFPLFLPFSTSFERTTTGAKKHLCALAIKYFCVLKFKCLLFIYAEIFCNTGKRRATLMAILYKTVLSCPLKWLSNNGWQICIINSVNM